MVYAALDRLSGDGWIERTGSDTVGGRVRFHDALTAAGRRTRVGGLGRVERWREVLDVAAQGVTARARATVSDRARLRIAQLSLASGVALAVMMLLLAEWSPGGVDKAPNNRFGPFATPGAAFHLATLLAAALLVARARRTARALTAFTLLAPGVLVALPHLVDQTRPTAPVLLVTWLLAIGVLLGWRPLAAGASRAAWPAAVGALAGGATWITNRTVSDGFDARFTVYSSMGGVHDLAAVVPVGLGVAVVVALLLVPLDPSWLVGVAVAGVPWTALTAVSLQRSDGIRTALGLLAVWCVTVAQPVGRRHRLIRRVTGGSAGPGRRR